MKNDGFPEGSITMALQCTPPNLSQELLMPQLKFSETLIVGNLVLQTSGAISD